MNQEGDFISYGIVLCDLLNNHKNEKSESFLARSFLLECFVADRQNLLDRGSGRPLHILSRGLSHHPPPEQSAFRVSPYPSSLNLQ